MDSPFDVFRVEGEEDLVWIAAAESLEHTKRPVQEAAATTPGKYLIYDQKSGTRTYFGPGNQISG